MKRIDGNRLAGFILEPGDILSFSILGPGDVIDKGTDLISWRGPTLENELEVVSCWHLRPVRPDHRDGRILRICDTGEIRARVEGVTHPQPPDGCPPDSNYRYGVTWLTPTDWRDWT